MPDTKAYKLRDASEPMDAPRLLNAAAWLETLAALETEFNGLGAKRRNPPFLRVDLLGGLRAFGANPPYI